MQRSQRSRKALSTQITRSTINGSLLNGQMRILRKKNKKPKRSSLFVSFIHIEKKKTNHLYSNHYALSLQLPHRLRTLSHQHQLNNIREQTAAYTEGAHVNVHVPVVSQVS